MSWLSLAIVLALLGGSSGSGSDSARGELARLVGQRVTVRPDGYTIDDIAGEGAPRVGVVEARGAELWLVGAGESLLLTGPLAQPRIACPGYKVWVVGARRGHELRARRLGVLAPPTR